MKGVGYNADPGSGSSVCLSEWCSIGIGGLTSLEKPDALRRSHYYVYLLCESSALKDFASLSGYLLPNYCHLPKTALGDVAPASQDLRLEANAVTGLDRLE